MRLGLGLKTWIEFDIQAIGFTYEQSMERDLWVYPTSYLPKQELISTTSIMGAIQTLFQYLKEYKDYFLTRQPILFEKLWFKASMINKSLPFYNFYPLVLDLSSGASKNLYSLSHMMTLHNLEESSTVLLSQTEVRKTFLPFTNIQHVQAQ